MKLGPYHYQVRQVDLDVLASVRIVARPGKNYAWKQAGGQIQGRRLRERAEAVGGSGTGSEGSPGESKKELGGLWG